jgi:hypothetical protein
MTTQLTPETDPTRTAPDANAELRAHADRALARAQAAEAELMGMRLEKIGLDPLKGLGKAIAKEYEGEYTLEAIAQYARDEYQHEYEVAEEESPIAAQIEAAQTQADQLAPSSVPIEPVSEDDIVAKHDQRLAQPDATIADAQAAVTDKMSKFVQETYR